MPRKLCLPLLLLVTSCAPAQAQLQVKTPASAACPPDQTTRTPVIGFIVEDEFGGIDGFQHSDALTDALEEAGFKVSGPHYINLLDHGSVKISGKIQNWRNANGDESRKRIGLVDIDIIDLNTQELIFKFKQPSAKLVFQAPTFEQVTQQIVGELSQRFCQFR
ncbi:hypothetical protein [Deinococcus gobiensis]|uniref:hypothetical protein n=1 Tax=Deinococcus gobiensis TaxID=502394 RepID=UPI0011AE5546|nr:hypothetical protein [Deinococcus gobiensis]